MKPNPVFAQIKERIQSKRAKSLGHIPAQGEGATNPRPTGPDGERGGGRARRRRSGRQQKGGGSKEEEEGDRFVRAAG